jgi:hypothetical protein
LRGSWAVGRGRTPPAWPVVATAGGPPFRVLWVGRPGIDAFAPPGGNPDGLVSAGSASVRYGVTGRAGRSVLEMGLPPHGPGYAALEAALRVVLVGRVRHGGAVLAPFGIRFVVAGPGDLPPEAADRLGEQLDLDLVQTAGGLSIYEVAAPFPITAAVGPEAAAVAQTSGTRASAEVTRAERAVLAPDAGAWRGPVRLEGAGAVLFSTPFDGRWQLRVDGASAPRFRAFRWGQGFRASFPADVVEIQYEDGWRRVLEISALVLLWAWALWATRARASARPAGPVQGPRESERPSREPVEAAP